MDVLRQLKIRPDYPEKYGLHNEEPREKAGGYWPGSLKSSVAGFVDLLLRGLGLDGKPSATPTPRIPQGKVTVLEGGPVYLDPDHNSGPSGGSGPNGSPAPTGSPAPKGGPSPKSGSGKSTSSGSGTPSGPAADDIGDWDTGNPYGFDTGAPNAPEVSGAKKGGIFKVIDDLLNFAQQ